MSEIRTSGRQLRIASRPSAADGHVRTSAPLFLSMVATSSSPSRSSSTTRTRSPRSDGPWSAASDGASDTGRGCAGSSARAMATGSLTVKVAPWPSPVLAACDGAAVQLDQVADERQAEAEPGVPARRRAVGLLEALEHVREHVGRDALPGIAHDDLDVGVTAAAGAPGCARPGA